MVGGALVLRWQWLASSPELSGVILLTAVAVAAILGGSGPGLVATGLSTVALMMRSDPASGSQLLTGLYATAGLIICWVAARHRRQLAHTNHNLQQRLHKYDGEIQLFRTQLQTLERHIQQQANTLNLLTTIAENTRDAIMVTEAEPLDEPGPRIIYVNSAFLKMTGYSRDEVLGRSPRFLQGPQTSRESRALIHKSLENRESCRVELINYTKDGTPYWVELDLTPVSQSGAGYIIAVQRDITARKHIEEELRKNEIRYRTLVEAVSAVTWTTPPGGSLIGPQPSWTAFTGQTSEEMANYGCTKVIHPDDLESVTQRWSEALRLSQPYESIHRIRRHDGQWRWMKTYAVPIRDDRDRIIEWFGIHIDITAERQALEQLAHRERELQTLLDHAPVIVSRFDRQLRHLFVSSAVEAVTGRSVSEFIGKTNRELGMPAELCDYWEEKMYAVFADGCPQQGEFTFPGPNGPRHFDLKLVPERDSQGRIETILGVAQDVTERFVAQDAVRRRDELLRKLTEQVPGILYQYREWPDGRCCFPYASPGIESIFEVTPEQVIDSGDFLFEWIHPDDFAMVRSSIDASKTHLHQWNCEFRMLLPRGGLRWIEGHSNPELLPDGSILWHGFIRDITERKQTEHQLRQSEARFRTLVENIQVGVVVLNPQGQITLANPAATDILGLQLDNFLGRLVFDPTWEIVREDGTLLEPEELPFSIVLRTCQPIRDVIVGSRHQRTGQRLWLQVNGTPELASDGSVRNVILTFIDITRLKQTEEDLRLKEAAIAESINGIVLTNSEQNIIYVNRAFRDLWGYDSENSVLGRNLRELWQDSPMVEPILGTLMDSGVFSGELTGQRKDGQRIDVQLTANRICDRMGRTSHFMFSMIDITDAKRAEEAQHEAEHRQELALMAGQMGTWEWQIGTDSLIWDDRVIQMMGLADNGFDGRLSTFLSLIYSEDLPKLQKVLADAALGQSFDGEFRIVAPDGGIRWIRCVAKVFCDNNGQAPRMIGIGYDVTERKHAENRLRQTNQLLQSVTRLQQDFLLQVQPQSVFQGMLQVLLDTTQSEYGFFGQVHRDAFGQPYLHTQAITDISWDEPTKRLYADYAAQGMIFTNLKTLFGHVMTTGQPVISNDPANDPRRGGLPPGHPPLDCFLGVPLYRGAELVGMVGLANRPGGYSESILETIQPLLSTCSSLIHAHQLQQQRNTMEDSLRSSLREKEAMLKEIHHRVKNNLQVISSLLNLQAERLEDTAHRAVFLESQNRVRAMALVHETLYGSESLAQIDLARYLERLCESLAQTYPGSDRITICQSVAPITVDLDRALPVGLIVSELVSNALKYAFPPPRSGQVQVVAYVTEDHYIVLTVGDDGVGLPRDFQLEQSKSLGLYLVRLLAQQLRGTITIDRTNGTMFTLRFPQ
jgi:PAS domain S-box-containing protein